eukprot:jgi/Ulvmu1/9325/UM050_0075.1
MQSSPRCLRQSRPRRICNSTPRAREPERTLTVRQQKPTLSLPSVPPSRPEGQYNGTLPPLCISDPLPTFHCRPRSSRSPPATPPAARSLSAREPPTRQLHSSRSPLNDCSDLNLLPPPCLLELIQLTTPRSPSPRVSARRTTVRSLRGRLAARPPPVDPTASAPRPARDTAEGIRMRIWLDARVDSARLSTSSTPSSSSSPAFSAQVARTDADAFTRQLLQGWECFWEPPGRVPEQPVRSTFDVMGVATGSPELEPQPQPPAPSPEASLDAAAVVQMPCASETASFLSAGDELPLLDMACAGPASTSATACEEERPAAAAAAVLTAGACSAPSQPGGPPAAPLRPCTLPYALSESLLPMAPTIGGMHSAARRRPTQQRSTTGAVAAPPRRVAKPSHSLSLHAAMECALVSSTALIAPAATHQLLAGSKPCQELHDKLADLGEMRSGQFVVMRASVDTPPPLTPSDMRCACTAQPDGGLDDENALDAGGGSSPPGPKAQKHPINSLPDVSTGHSITRHSIPALSAAKSAVKGWLAHLRPRDASQVRPGGAMHSTHSTAGRLSSIETALMRESVRGTEKGVRGWKKWPPAAAMDRGDLLQKVRRNIVAPCKRLVLRLHGVLTRCTDRRRVLQGMAP